MFKLTSIIGSTTGLLLFALNSYATTVQFQTSHGDFEVILFDEQTPKTVENFLQYVNEEAYEDSIVHRSATNFVIQGGGFNLTDDALFNPINIHSQVENEAYYSNVRATISMAKRSGLPNSATSQWFINLGNNSTNNANLDYANGGYTVFGQVIGNGMDVVDAIAALPIHDVDDETGGTGAAESVPLQNFDPEGQEKKPLHDNFVIIYDVIVTDAATNNAEQLEPQPLVIQPRAATPAAPAPKKSGGSMSFSSIIGLLILVSAPLLFRRRR